MAQWVADRETAEPPPGATISAIIDAYLDDRRGHVEAFDRLELAATHIRRLVGNLRPDQLGRRLYWDRRKVAGVKPATIIREGVTLRAALKLEYKNEWIDRIPDVAVPPKQPPRERFLSRAEAEKLLEACESPHIRLFVLVALHTAARKGAILDLTWDRVDFETNLVSFRLNGRAESKKRRSLVPINSVLRPALEEALAARTTDFVIEWNGKPVDNIRHPLKTPSAAPASPTAPATICAAPRPAGWSWPASPSPRWRRCWATPSR
jgi:integrase